MKLYFAPMACSLAPHIVMRELDLEFRLVGVNNKTKKTTEGKDFLAVNPKGYVAALALPDGRILTEAPAILQYLADQSPQGQLAPAPTSRERPRLQEWLNFIATELHASASPLFDERIPDTVKAIYKDKLFKRFDFLANTLEHQDYLLVRYGVADPYLYTVLTWMPRFSIEIDQWPALHRYMKRIGARQAVLEAEAAERRIRIP
ncbi:glutathione transferase GstA [Halomonas elongata]|uniref:glutathione transferase GstA n=1 Tax=Halomonas elongata TaxID=2746 RepID=UPI003361AA46